LKRKRNPLLKPQMILKRRRRRRKTTKRMKSRKPFQRRKRLGSCKKGLTRLKKNYPS